MIVLGVAPGLRALSYCVLSFHDEAEKADIVDCDVLLNGRAPKPQNMWDATKRGRVHNLILGVVCERHTPAVVALGPPLVSGETSEHVSAVRMTIRLLAGGFGIPVYEFRARQDVQRRLHCCDRALAKGVEDYVDAKATSQDRRVVLAMATAAAGYLCAKGEICVDN